MIRASGVYQILNRINGKSYVGSAASFQRRWATHKKSLNEGRHHSIPLQRAWIKYGESTFEFKVLEIVPETKLLLAREQSWMDGIAPEYNVARVAGSSLGITRSEETRKRLREGWTAERRAAQAARIANRKGVPLTTRHKEAISAAAVGRVRSESHRHRLAMSLGGYPVKGTAIDTGEIITAPYVSALRELGFHPDHVRDCTNGKRKTHKGYRWERMDLAPDGFFLLVRER